MATEENSMLGRFRAAMAHWWRVLTHSLSHLFCPAMVLVSPFFSQPIQPCALLSSFFFRYG